jgi:hypothetical protein
MPNVTAAEAEKAAKVFEKNKPAIQRLLAELGPAEKLLKEWFREHPDREDYKGRIGYSATTQIRLDTDKVKLELGKRLGRFQKSVPVESLRVLEKKK